jgi:23S rRNA pseudouridine2605 synthase
MPSDRLQKLIARAGIASRRHAEQLILSGQVRVNGQVVTELGTKADLATDKVEAAGKLITAPEEHVYLALNKPVDVVAAMADPEGRKTLVNSLRGFPARVYPVGNLEYAASGLVLLTNDGDFAAALLKNWEHLEQGYHIKIKGMLRRDQLAHLGKEAGVRLQTLRQPDSTRGHAANYWYELRMRDTKKESLRHVMFKAGHPIEKWIRISLGSLSIEGIPRNRYRALKPSEIEDLRKSAEPKPRATHAARKK